MVSGVHEENSSSQNGNQYILSISTKEAAGGMCKITCSGAFFFVPLAVCEELELTEGLLLSEEVLSRLLFLHQSFQAYRKSLDLLSRKDHSMEMLRLKLRQRSYPDPVISKVLQHLQAEELVDDRKFGEHYLRYLLNKKKYGKRTLLAKLRGKGLSRELAEDLAGTVAEAEEAEALNASAEKLYGRRNMTKEKMLRSLLAKGFPPSKVYSCIEEYFRF